MAMTGTAQRILIRGGRVYDHDGDVHQPAQADILNPWVPRNGPSIDDLYDLFDFGHL